MKKGFSFLLVILFGFAAVIWVARVVVDVVCGVPDISMAVFLLDILAAFIWVSAFTVQFFRYRAGKMDK